MKPYNASEIVLQPIGVVHSSVKEGASMPIEGVSAQVEIFPQYAEGLKGIETNTHLIIIGWFHQADRSSLLLERNREGKIQHRGVFGLRSPGRPNLLGLSTARLLKIKGRILELDRLDMVEGTPVVDVKRYSPGWDSIFSARTSRDITFPHGRDRQSFMEDMLVEAVNFHGESCPGVQMGVRIIFYAMETWDIGAKAEEIVMGLGRDNCINDALQGLSGATLGNGRLKVRSGATYRIDCRGQRLTFTPKAQLPPRPLDADTRSLFTIRRGSSPQSPHRGFLKPKVEL